MTAAAGDTKPPERSRATSRTLAAITTAILLVALAVAGYELLAQQRILGQINRESVWSASQINREFAALREAIAVHAVSPDRVPADAVRRQVDLFWSRVPTIVDHPEGVRALDDATLTNRFLVLRDALPELDPLIDAFLADPNRDPDPLLLWLDRWRPAMDAVLLQAIRRDDTEALVESLLRENRRGMFAALVALLTAITMTLIMGRDLRATRQLQEAYRSSSETASAARDRLRAAIDAMDSAFLLVDEVDSILLANRGAQDLFPELGRIGPTERSPAALARAIPELPLAPGINRKRLSDGRLIDGFVTQTESGSLLAVYRDVTDREREERERSSLAAQLHQAQKQEALGRLAGGIAHDFNNILGAIRGFADILNDDLPADSALKPYADQIVRAADRATDLVKRILLFSRPYSGDTQSMDLNAVVRDNVTMLKAGLSSAVRITVEASPDPLLVKGDPTQIGQVLVNLIVNARDAMSGRPGEIHVRSEALEIDGGRAAGMVQEGLGSDATLKISDGEEGIVRGWFGVLPTRGLHARLTVTDRGTGIGRAVVERMFDPFFTTKEAGRGTGLGLSTVQGIVLAHRGALTLETKPGSFTTIAILLPLGDTDEPASADAPTTRATALPGERLILVDDEPAVADATAIGLRRRGWEVEVATGAEEALAVLADRPSGWFSLVVTDQTMPGMSGVDLIAVLAERDPTLPVILCTGHGQIGTGEAAKAAGASAFLRKPLIGDRLAATVRQVLDERRRDDDGRRGAATDPGIGAPSPSNARSGPVDAI